MKARSRYDKYSWLNGVHDRALAESVAQAYDAILEAAKYDEIVKKREEAIAVERVQDLLNRLGLTDAKVIRRHYGGIEVHYRHMIISIRQDSFPSCLEFYPDHDGSIEGRYIYEQLKNLPQFKYVDSHGSWHKPTNRFGYTKYLNPLHLVLLAIKHIEVPDSRETLVRKISQYQVDECFVLSDRWAFHEGKSALDGLMCYVFNDQARENREYLGNAIEFLGLDPNDVDTYTLIEFTTGKMPMEQYLKYFDWLCDVKYGGGRSAPFMAFKNFTMVRSAKPLGREIAERVVHVIECDPLDYINVGKRSYPGWPFGDDISEYARRLVNA